MGTIGIRLATPSFTVAGRVLPVPSALVRNRAFRGDGLGDAALGLGAAERAGLPMGSERAAETYGACLRVRTGGRGNCEGERLEFLGDAVLYLVTADILHGAEDATVQTPRGMHANRAPVLTNAYLAERAREIGIEALVRNERARLKLPPGGLGPCADATEALVGAVYRLEGYDAAADWIARRLLPERFPGRDAFLRDAFLRRRAFASPSNL